jgi:hypothetical protein
MWANLLASYVVESSSPAPMRSTKPWWTIIFGNKLFQCPGIKDAAIKPLHCSATCPARRG